MTAQDAAAGAPAEPSDDAPEGFTARNWLVIGLLLVAAFTVTLNETVLIVAIPRLMAAFDTTAAAAQWLTTAFLLTMVVVIPVTGYLIQRFNTRPLFVAAMVLFCLGTLAAAPARAEIQSTYTDIDLNQCTVLESTEFGVTWACPGYKGYPVWIAEGDLRFFVSYGFGAPGQPAASQTLGPLNTLGPRIEWRMTDAGGDWQPFATILRYITESETYRGEALVVTRLGPDGVCQVAWIDARANPDANELARDAADTIAPLFACGQEPLILGNRGPSF